MRLYQKNYLPKGRILYYPICTTSKLKKRMEMRLENFFEKESAKYGLINFHFKQRKLSCFIFYIVQQTVIRGLFCQVQLFQVSYQSIYISKSFFSIKANRVESLNVHRYIQSQYQNQNCLYINSLLHYCLKKLVQYISAL